MVKKSIRISITFRRIQKRECSTEMLLMQSQLSSYYCSVFRIILSYQATILFFVFQHKRVTLLGCFVLLSFNTLKRSHTPFAIKFSGKRRFIESRKKKYRKVILKYLRRFKYRQLDKIIKNDSKNNKKRISVILHKESASNVEKRLNSVLRSFMLLPREGYTHDKH